MAVVPPGGEAMPHPEAPTLVTATPLPEVLQRAQRDNALKAAVLIGMALAALLMQPGLFWLWPLLAAAGWSLLRNTAVRREYQRRRLALFAARRELTRLRSCLLYTIRCV